MKMRLALRMRSHPSNGLFARETDMTLLHLAAAAEGRPRIQIAADTDDHDADKALRHFNATALAEALPAAGDLISGVVH